MAHMTSREKAQKHMKKMRAGGGSKRGASVGVQSDESRYLGLKFDIEHGHSTPGRIAELAKLEAERAARLKEQHDTKISEIEQEYTEEIDALNVRIAKYETMVAEGEKLLPLATEKADKKKANRLLRRGKRMLKKVQEKVAAVVSTREAWHNSEAYSQLPK